MAQGRVDEAARAMEGRLITGRPETRWSGAALDSRQVLGGELFFALPGETSDGHLYVSDAWARGASAAVVHRDVESPEGAATIRVENTYEALHRLTRAVRERTPRQLVAITGSIGKTTTKELLAVMLGQRHRVARNPGNLNNLYGFPIALLSIPEDTEWMVAEMGMSTAGELGQISRLGRPDVAIFTNVRPVHLEFFASLEEIADAKAELLEGLKPDGLVVANRDDDQVVRIAERHRGPIVWFGIEQPAVYRAVGIETEAGVGSRFTLVAGRERVEIRLPLFGSFNVENCLAAAACAHSLGTTLEEISSSMTTVEPVARRGIVHRLSGERVVVDDSYNSNPAALSQALASARELPGARHWAVLGEMLELGPTGPDLHRAAGVEAFELGFSPLVGVGELARHLVDGARDAGGDAIWFEDSTTAARDLGIRLEKGDVVLVKGSRGVAMEHVVEALLEQGGEGG